MINLCFDKIIEDPPIDVIEKDWVKYLKYATKFKYGIHDSFPDLQSFKDFDDASVNFKKMCQSMSLDPESHKKRLGFKKTPYPTCTRHIAKFNDPSWGGFSEVYPNTEHFRLVDYLQEENMVHQIYAVDDAPNGSFYCIGIDTYHLDFDYFSEMSDSALYRLKAGEINVLFFYHEADNPQPIKTHLDNLCVKHGIKPTQIHFISGNTGAEEIDNFYYFFDDEILYKLSLRKDQTVPFHTDPREKNFTALVRVNKLWRAMFMADIWNQGLHKRGYFSYNKVSQKEKHELVTEPFDDIFVEQRFPMVEQFFNAAPFKADNLSDEEHNSFKSLVKEHYSNSYCNFVIETYFSIEHTLDTSLTEKIIKPICHNQFFIVVAPPFTLKEIRKLGYKTFDRVIDESYDEIEDPEERMLAVIKLCSDIAAMSKEDIHNLYLSLEPEIKYNSELFHSEKKDRLKKLVKKITMDQKINSSPFHSAMKRLHDSMKNGKK